MQRRQRVRVGERTLSVSSLDKVLYPETGTTKADVLRYYLGVAEVMLPHLTGRPVTLRRWPEGVEGEAFFQKRCPDGRPEWLRTVPMGRGDEAPVPYCVLEEPASLAWAANLGALELHVPMGRAPRVEAPTAVVFDLDPGAPADILDCAWLALRLREALEHLELTGVAKTSGGKGLQVYVPVDSTSTDPAQARGFAHQLAQTLERLHQARIVTTQTRKERAGKVLIDWSQNHPSKTTVCVYSLRGTTRPRVSTPISWDEVAAADAEQDPHLLRFEAEHVLERIQAHGDLFASVRTGAQRLPRFT